MVVAYSFHPSTLYLNITNQCTNDCVFCYKKFNNYFLGPYNLRLSREPSTEEIILAVDSAIGQMGRGFGELVFCGFGEPLIRWEVILEVAQILKKKGERLRINTNGIANQFHNTNILPSLSGIIDAISVSLNAENARKYYLLCKPRFGSETYDLVKEFIRESKKYIPQVTATVVGGTPIDIDECWKVATHELGVNFRVR